MATRQNPKKLQVRLHVDHEKFLQTLLHGLKDGVIVCDRAAKVIFSNNAAREVFSRSRSLRRGSSLYRLFFRPPVEHGLSLLQYQQAGQGSAKPLHAIRFMNSTTGQDRFFRCSLSFLASQSGKEHFFILIFEDVSSWYRPENPLSMKIEEFRAPMTNLRAAVENLTEHPEMSPVMRSAFENVLVQESLNLTAAFDALAQACHVILQSQTHLVEMNTGLLFRFVVDHLERRKIRCAVFPGAAAGAKVDSYGLILVLDYLAAIIGQERKGVDLACEITVGDQFIYFDFVWSGDFLPTSFVETMLPEKLPESVGGLTVGDILHAMEGDIWSRQLDASRSTLRLALPIVAKKPAEQA